MPWLKLRPKQQLLPHKLPLPQKLLRMQLQLRLLQLQLQLRLLRMLLLLQQLLRLHKPRLNRLPLQRQPMPLLQQQLHKQPLLLPRKLQLTLPPQLQLPMLSLHKPLPISPRKQRLMPLSP